MSLVVSPVRSRGSLNDNLVSNAGNKYVVKERKEEASDGDSEGKNDGAGTDTVTDTKTKRKPVVSSTCVVS